MKAGRPRCTRPAPGGETVTVFENVSLNYIVFTYEGSDIDNDKVVFTPNETTKPFFFDGMNKHDEYFRANAPLDFETKNQYIFKNI